MRHDIISDMFAIIKNAESIGKDSCQVPVSNLVKNMLTIMDKEGYIEGFRQLDEGKGRKIKIKLAGKINGCGSIKPRFSTSKHDFIDWEKRFLPANNIGLLLVSTSQGVVSHKEAKKKGMGGKLLGYVY